MKPIPKRRTAAPVIATLVALVCAAPALGSSQRGYARMVPACGPPAPGEATCFAVGRVPVPASEARRAGVRPLAVSPAAAPEAGPAGGLSPAQLAGAYRFDPGAKGGEGQTVAVIDAFDNPNIESDLAAFSEQYGLPPCTSADGCFKKVNEFGSTSKASLPSPDEDGWSVEVSLDVEAVHAACRTCHILLVESDDALMTDLATAVNTAVEMGADEVSNSYGAVEQGPPSRLERAAYDHPGVVIAAATGDLGYDGWLEEPSPGVPDVPASMPSVVSVGGTTLKLEPEGGRKSETVWNSLGPEDAFLFGGATGGGCSSLFAANFWQRWAPGYAATGCGNRRLSADVSAVADPFTGFDIYDTYECGKPCTELKGPEAWSMIGGTSLSTPLISAMYALAGGPGGIAYPSLTLYAHLGEPSSLLDVTQGGNGYCDNGGGACGVNALAAEDLDCEGVTSCNAAPGYDGPSGVGAPASLEAFEPLPEEEQNARRKAEEAVEAEARRKAEEEAARQPQAGAAPKAPTPSSGQGGTAGFKAFKAAVPAAMLHGSRLHAGRRGFLTLKVGCPTGETVCAGVVSLRTLGAVIAGPGARASILTLASGRFRVAGGQVAGVRLRLTRRGAALLARRGKLRVRVLIVAHDPAGAAHSSHAAATLYAFTRR